MESFTGGVAQDVIYVFIFLLGTCHINEMVTQIDPYVLLATPLQDYQLTPPNVHDLLKPQYMLAAHHTHIEMFRPP